MTSLTPGIHLNVPRAVYDSDSGLNNSTIKAFKHAVTPAHFRWDQDHPKEKKCFTIGNAVDCLVSEPKKFPELFAIWEGDRKQGKLWEAFEELAKAKGQEVLKKSEMEEVNGMLQGLKDNAEVWNIVSNSERQVMIVANHPQYGRTKCLLDIYPGIESEWIFDTKTTGVGANPEAFHKQIFDLKYHWQGNFYSRNARIAGMKQVNGFGFIAQESYAPYLSAVHYMEITDEIMQRAEQEQQETVPIYKKHLRENNWPGYPKAWTKVKFKPWMLNPYQNQYETID